VRLWSFRSSTGFETKTEPVPVDVPGPGLAAIAAVDAIATNTNAARCRKDYVAKHSPFLVLAGRSAYKGFPTRWAAAAAMNVYFF
jgi:hypothetical protein